MHPQSGHVQAPPLGSQSHLLQTGEVAAPEEALADVLDAPLHLGLVLGVSHPGGIGDEAPVLGVFQEATGEPGVQRVGPRDCGGEVVDDQVPGDAAEEGPGRLQAGDDVLQLLADGGPDEAVPGVTQHHDQGPQPGTANTVSLSADRLPAETAKPPVSRGTGYVWTVRPSRAPTRLSARRTARSTADRGARREGRGPSGRSTGA